MPRTCRGFKNEDNDLKCIAAALKLLSHESQPESQNWKWSYTCSGNWGLICASPVYFLETDFICVLSRGLRKKSTWTNSSVDWDVLRLTVSAEPQSMLKAQFHSWGLLPNFDGFFFILTLTIKSSIKLLIISDIYMGVHRCFPRNVSSILSTFFAMLQLFLELKSIHLGLFFFILDPVAALLSGHGCPV